MTFKDGSNIDARQGGNSFVTSFLKFFTVSSEDKVNNIINTIKKLKVEYCALPDNNTKNKERDRIHQEIKYEISKLEKIN